MLPDRTTTRPNRGELSMRMLPLLLAALVLALPTTTPAAEPASDTTASTEASDASGADYDPWQRMNRGIFWFNDQADHYVLEPVAKGWDVVMPEPAETGISNFFANLR